MHAEGMIDLRELVADGETAVGRRDLAAAIADELYQEGGAEPGLPAAGARAALGTESGRSGSTRRPPQIHGAGGPADHRTRSGRHDAAEGLPFGGMQRLRRRRCVPAFHCLLHRQSSC